MDKVLEEVLQRVFNDTIESIISDKLSDAGIQNPKLTRDLMDFIQKKGGDVFHFEGDEVDRNVEISFSKEDFEKIGKLHNYVKSDAFSKIVREVAEQAAGWVIEDLLVKWSDEKQQQKNDIRVFKGNLEDRWGKPLDLLRMLLTVGREWLGETNKAMLKSKSRKTVHLREVMVRLCARACQVTEEIICLLENGFADGAMARWRTLHEINVVLSVIMKFGEDIAKRYIDFQSVEAMNGLKKYMECHEKLGYAPFSKREASKVIKEYDRVIKIYGDEFKGLYGWAAHHLKKKKPTFVDIEIVAELEAMRSYYYLASSNVHAGVHGAFYRLGLIGDRTVLLAGRSNAGLTEAGQNTALTFTQICVFASGIKENFDYLVCSNVMIKLRDMIPPAFSKAERKLERDEKKFKNIKKC